MELKVFLAELSAGLSRLDFVVSLDLRTEAFTVKGRVRLKEQGFLEIYFNERTQTLALARMMRGNASGASIGTICGVGTDTLCTILTSINRCPPRAFVTF